MIKPTKHILDFDGNVLASYLEDLIAKDKLRAFEISPKIVKEETPQEFIIRIAKSCQLSPTKNLKWLDNYLLENVDMKRDYLFSRSRLDLGREVKKYFIDLKRLSPNSDRSGIAAYPSIVELDGDSKGCSAGPAADPKSFFDATLAIMYEASYSHVIGGIEAYVTRDDPLFNQILALYENKEQPSVKAVRDVLPA